MHALEEVFLSHLIWKYLKPFPLKKTKSVTKILKFEGLEGKARKKFFILPRFYYHLHLLRNILFALIINYRARDEN